ncbi:MAG: hypothetical protein J2P25_17140 [Nocardiopsaceae bacterium]|nr:hypothetical protein [Nocardiopsaceae bacterium]
MQPAFRPPPERVDLYSRSWSAGRVFHLCMVVVCMIILVPVLGVAVFGMLSFVSPAAGVTGGILVWLLAEVAMLFTLLRVVRSAAWLEGGVLVVRTAFATRRCDLASATDAALESVLSSPTLMPMPGGGMVAAGGGQRIPVLSVSDGPGRKPVRLRLVEPYRGRGKQLPAPKLIALADALRSGQRAPWNEPVQHAVAGLHAMAANPAAG